MPKLPILSGKRVVKMLKKDGYRVIKKRGSHFRLQNNDGTCVTVSDHKIIGRGL